MSILDTITDFYSTSTVTTGIIHLPKFLLFNRYIPLQYLVCNITSARHRLVILYQVPGIWHWLVRYRYINQSNYVGVSVPMSSPSFPLQSIQREDFALSNYQHPYALVQVRRVQKSVANRNATRRYHGSPNVTAYAKERDTWMSQSTKRVHKYVSMVFLTPALKIKNDRSILHWCFSPRKAWDRQREPNMTFPGAWIVVRSRRGAMRSKKWVGLKIVPRRLVQLVLHLTIFFTVYFFRIRFSSCTVWTTWCNCRS